MCPANRRRPDPPARPRRRAHTGAAFGLAGPRARGEDLDETAVMEIALAMREKLAAVGITTELAHGESGIELHGTGEYETMVSSLGPTVFELAGHDRSEWDRILDVRVDQAVRTLASVKRRWPGTPEQWRAAVRTRLIDPDVSCRYGSPVHRPFGGNLVLALYLRLDGGVMPIYSEHLKDCPLSADELFEAGQRNTDRAPLVHRGPIGAGAWALHGEGFFTASKAANLGAVLDGIDVGADAGVLFCLPHKHVLGLHPIDPDDPYWALNSMALLHRDETDRHVDPMLSPFIFHRAPTGEVEAVAVPGGVIYDDPRVLILPAPRFDAILDAAGCESTPVRCAGAGDRLPGRMGAGGGLRSPGRGAAGTRAG